MFSLSKCDWFGVEILGFDWAQTNGLNLAESIFLSPLSMTIITFITSSFDFGSLVTMRASTLVIVSFFKPVDFESSDSVRFPIFAISVFSTKWFELWSFSTELKFSHFSMDSSTSEASKNFSRAQKYMFKVSRRCS